MIADFNWLDRKELEFNFQELKHIDFNIGIIILQMSIGVSNLYICCYFGKLATENFEQMAHPLYESN